MPSGKWTNSNRVNRLPPGWYRVMRPRVFAQWGTICHICRKDGADQIDHLVPGDDHSLDNLRPAHKACHSKKSAQEGVEARARRRADLKHPSTRESHPGLQ